MDAFWIGLFVSSILVLLAQNIHLHVRVSDLEFRMKKVDEELHPETKLLVNRY